MSYNPNIHHRRSVRLKGYDYSFEGLYFITVCCQDRVCWFGGIEEGKMVLNDVGLMIDKWFYELENKFHDIKCHDMVIMPNHIHFIVENIGSPKIVTSTATPPVGANLRVRPTNNVHPTNFIPPIENIQSNEFVQSNKHGENIQGEHIGSPLRGVIQWFKTMTTNEYIRGVKQLGWESFDGKLWQRNYYEHIIRNEKSYLRIAQYINNNPEHWKEDKMFEEMK
ncbi:MAG: hypothetical protein H6Q15_370 [Bacteroidetes bacterium]|nr:hypothetical protein [Bacteroidota bacterium]